MIYLACPYSHPEPAIREHRYQLANRAAAKLIQSGRVVFSPLSHSHPIAQTGLIHPHAPVWYQQDMEFLKLATELQVLCLPGWKDSRGVSAEIAFAHDHGKFVIYLPPEFACE